MLTEQAVERIKGLFSDWVEMNDSKKELSSHMNELIGSAADTAGVKKPVMRKVFNFIKTKKEKSIDELDEIVNIFMAVDSR
jgi:hypothetical protein